MTTKSQTTTKTSTGPRKRPSAQAKTSSPVSSTGHVTESANLPKTFQAALNEWAEKHVAEQTQVPVQKQVPDQKKASARRRPSTALATRQVIDVPQVVSRPTALSRSWSWLRSKCSDVYRKDAQRAIEQQNPQALLTAAATQMVANRRPTQKSSSSLVRTKAAQPVQQQGNAMTRAFSWLQTKYTMSSPKRLRVTETVSLGEKRFVSVICVDGREFLIGGGASSVSILASLGPQGANLIPELSVEKVS